MERFSVLLLYPDYVICSSADPAETYLAHVFAGSSMHAIVEAKTTMIAELKESDVVIDHPDDLFTLLVCSGWIQDIK